MSPNPIWNYVLLSISTVAFVNIFVLLPIAFIYLGRIFDKKFVLKYYTIEKGTWFLGPGIRLSHYTLGILLQPYRDNKIKSKLLAELIRKRFAYQDKLYGQKVDFRKFASKGQVVISALLWIGFVLLIIAAFLLLVHDFVVYPEIGQSHISNN